MTRIHDALKKAERERSFKVIGIEERESPDAIPVAERIPESSVGDVGSSHSTSHVSFAPDPITLDTLLANCPPTNWKLNPKTMLFCDSDERFGAEQFRSLRSHLCQLRDKQPLRRIVVTSSVAKEGRSFVAANLAQVMALQPGCRALLIDGDLRNPSLHSVLGVSASPGLSDYVHGETDECGIIQRGQLRNLFFIASGRPVSGQAEILSNPRFKDLLDRLESIFDWIIIDSPAAIHVSDAGLIANYCEGVLIVVRSDSTPFDMVRKARQRFPYERLLGVVLNEIPADV
jgi:capsular exopolysaccharide synthesis family protein